MLIFCLGTSFEAKMDGVIKPQTFQTWKLLILSQNATNQPKFDRRTWLHETLGSYG